MLTFYYHPLSPISRRVWIALLEKEIPFEPILIDLRGKQLKDDFLAINPFHHVPVIVHEGIRLIESLAILDYLDHRFPAVPFSPTSPAELANMRMVQLMVTNELLPKLVSVVNAEQSPMPPENVHHLAICFQFLEKQLGDRAYFGGDNINLADIVAGSTVPLFCRLGVSLQPYASLRAWQARLVERSAWVLTNPSDRDLQRWKRWIQLQVKRYQRNRVRDK